MPLVCTQGRGSEGLLAWDGHHPRRSRENPHPRPLPRVPGEGDKSLSCRATPVSRVSLVSCDDLLRRVPVPRGVGRAHVGQHEISRADGLSRRGPVLEVGEVVLDPAGERHVRAGRGRRARGGGGRSGRPGRAELVDVPGGCRTGRGGGWRVGSISTRASQPIRSNASAVSRVEYCRTVENRVVSSSTRGRRGGLVPNSAASSSARPKRCSGFSSRSRISASRGDDRSCSSPSSRSRIAPLSSPCPITYDGRPMNGSAADEPLQLVGPVRPDEPPEPLLLDRPARAGVVVDHQAMQRDVRVRLQHEHRLLACP